VPGRATPGSGTCNFHISVHRTLTDSAVEGHPSMEQVKPTRKTLFLHQQEPISIHHLP
jgi:hypothetical protein